MTKYIGYISLLITILGIIIGGSLSYGRLEAKVEKSVEKTALAEKKIEDLEKDNNKLDKAMTEQTVKLEYIQKSVDDTNQNIKDLVKELRK